VAWGNPVLTHRAMLRQKLKEWIKAG
jgi:hypothetical protein